MKHTVKSSHVISTILLTSVLSACGGSSSTTESTTQPITQPTTSTTNSVPVANAGADQNVTVGATIQLSANQSSDSDGDSLTYLWQLTSKPSDSSATLSNNTNENISFTVDVIGNYTFSLIVNDGTIDSNSDTVTITASQVNTAATDITNIILTKKDGDCGQYIGTYIANVEDLQRAIGFAADIVITATNDKCSFAVNEIPNHDFNDSSASFASNVAAQNGNYQVPRMPTFSTTPTTLSLATTNAILLNGVVIDLLAAACYNVGNEPLGQEKIGCGQNEINNPWRYDPMSPLNGFGTDMHNAHVQPDGTYHYHGNPVALFTSDCDITAEDSPVIGFAADGFPIYGACFNDSGTIRKAISSFQLKNGGGIRQDVSGYTTPAAGTGNIASNTYDGQFRGDYEFVKDSGDLDECNGMTVDGQYGYYITDSYPWVMSCFKGEPDSSMIKTGTALQNRLHTHSDSTYHSH